MDDIAAIKLLAQLVDVIQDKDGAAELLQNLRDHEAAAAESLSQAQERLDKAAQIHSDAQAARDDTARIRDEMLTKLLPREKEVAAGAQMLVQTRVELDGRAKEIARRETEMTRRENAAAAREEKLGRDEDALVGEKTRVAAMKESYETKLDSIRKAAAG